ncbi:MAG: carboxypeptidase-like regulatory domain-containing protein [Saprospiraceae bacterium]|nr:carboxypeptidase-like regulatory domain-containing protein [Saprospiraceae bacterium]MBP7679479.1 carboxypeptidase-like regulatory domain-containing protein [Saprospiraceae bacterium]
MHRRFIFIATSLLFSLITFAQTGSIQGTVSDALSHERLMGAIISLDGTNKGTSTDFDGNFILENIVAGTYTLSISYVSYTSKKIPVKVVENTATDLVNISLSEATEVLQEVVVRATKKTSTETAIVLETKKMNPIAVGVSAQQIAKTLDRDASQVMRRVPGISIMDDRFVMIRGLNERYNTVLLNDVITPSTEVDARAFSFDLLPANAIDRIVVYKTASAENAGEMAGGVIKIYTKSRIDENTTTFGFSTAYRTGTTNLQALQYAGGKLDMLGFDDGTRALPQNFGNRAILNGNNRVAANEQFRRFLPMYNVSNQTIMPDLRANLGLSRIFNIGALDVSNITNVNYSMSNLLPQNATQERYEGINNNELAYQWRDAASVQQVRLSAMSNFNILLSEKSKIEFRNLFYQAATNETLMREGTNENEQIDFRNYAFRYETRSIYSTQLSGTHDMQQQAKLTWNVGYGFTNRYEPDYRRIATSRISGKTDEQYKIDVPPVANPSLTQAARFWSALNEHIATAALNYEKDITIRGMVVKTQVGAFEEVKIRDFNARWFGYINPNNSERIYQLPEIFFDEQNITTNAGGISLLEGTNYDDHYTAQNSLSAAYMSAVIPFTSRISTQIGLRGEFNRQQLQSRLRGSGTSVTVNNPIISPFPSLNVTYKINKMQQLRFAYGMTVNRPEFREIAPFSYYDFNLNISKSGNPDLKTASIHNIDARYEIYPSDGELITVAAFYKYFINPIEISGRAAGSGTAFFYANPNSAKSVGFEIEVRKNIKGFLQNRLTIVANGSLIYSRVDASNLAGQIANRPLQGQSPYLVNLGLYYNHDLFQANILYNVIGKRIFVAGDLLGNQTIYEMPRNVIDINISKPVGQKLEFKLGISDLFNQANRFTADSNNDAKIDGNDKNWRSFSRGSLISLGATYKL